MVQTKNKQEIAVKKERYEQRAANKKPLLRIAYLMNQYHSVDHRYTSEDDKTEIKKLLESELTKHIDGIDKKMKPMFMRAIKNKGEWEHLRNLIV